MAHDILTQGLPPLKLNANLKISAANHTIDMLNNNFYGDDSSDGKTPDQRIRATGYNPRATGEALGVLGFINFIEPSEAVNRIFEIIYKDELNPERTKPRNILSYEFEETGFRLMPVY